MTAFKIVNGLKIATNDDQIAARLNASFEASNTKLESALRSILAPADPVDAPPVQASALGTKRDGSFRDRVRTVKAKPPQGTSLL